MTTVPIVLTDGSIYEMSIENLSTEQVFELVRAGTMSFTIFEEWRDSVFSAGSDSAN